MKKRIIPGFIAVAFVLAAALMAPAQARAGVDVNISIPLFGLFGGGVYAPAPPAVYAPAPPVYYAPQPVVEAVFYGGYWYRPSNGNWFISARAGGPWTFVGIDRVPYAVISGPVLMHRAPAYGYGRPMMGPGYGRGWHGRGYRHED